MAKNFILKVLLGKHFFFIFIKKNGISIKNKIRGWIRIEETGCLLTEGLEFSLAFVKKFKVNNTLKNQHPDPKTACFLCFKEANKVGVSCNHPYNKCRLCNNENLTLSGSCDFCGNVENTMVFEKDENGKIIRKNH